VSPLLPVPQAPLSFGTGTRPLQGQEQANNTLHCYRCAPARPRREIPARPAVCDYSFIFSQKLRGLTKRIISPGSGEAFALPQVFAVAMPDCTISFVGNALIASHEKSAVRGSHDT
jgi:hypothetical protein